MGELSTYCVALHFKEIEPDYIILVPSATDKDDACEQAKKLFELCKDRTVLRALAYKFDVPVVLYTIPQEETMYTTQDLMKLTLNQVENLYNLGIISQDAYEEYYQEGWVSTKDHLMGAHIPCHCKICLPGGMKDE